MGRITISDLHGYLIDERNSGSLTEIPSTLYEEVYAEVAEIRKNVEQMNDPFGEGVQSLIKERESLREYIKEIYSERTHKILSIALAKGNGEEINREDVRAMVSGERELFNAISETAQACRKALLDGKHIEVSTSSYHFGLSDNGLNSQSTQEISAKATENIEALAAHADEVFSEENADAETAPKSYRVIMIRDKIEEFQDYSGHVYSLSPGDIVSLPESMAEILCSRNIALNIRLRK